MKLYFKIIVAPIWLASSSWIGSYLFHAYVPDGWASGWMAIPVLATIFAFIIITCLGIGLYLGKILPSP